MAKGKNIAIGAAIAGFVGYVAGVLTAPKSGKETRQDIKDKAVETKREVEKRLKELHSQLDDLLKQGKSASAKASDQAKKEWEKLAKVALDSKEKVRAVLSSIHEGGTKDKDLQRAVHEASAAVDSIKEYLRKNVSAKS